MRTRIAFAAALVAAALLGSVGPALAAGENKGPVPIDIIGPVFAVPAEGVSVTGGLLNGGLGM